MALIDSGQLTALAEDIVPPLPADPTQEQIDGRQAAVDNTKELCQKIMQYLIDHLEILGVSVGTGTLLTPPPIVTPADGGVTLFGSTLVPQINGKSITQDNPGTGLIQ